MSLSYDRDAISTEDQTPYKRAPTCLFFGQKLVLIDSPPRADHLADQTAHPILSLSFYTLQILRRNFGRLPPSTRNVQLQQFTSGNVGTHHDALDERFLRGVRRRFDEGVKGASGVMNVESLPDRVLRFAI